MAEWWLGPTTVTSVGTSQDYYATVEFYNPTINSGGNARVLLSV